MAGARCSAKGVQRHAGGRAVSAGSEQRHAVGMLVRHGPWGRVFGTNLRLES